MIRISQWYCFGCGWDCNINVWKTDIGDRYICKSCGMSGNMSNIDAPQLIDPDSQDMREPTLDFEQRLQRNRRAQS